MANFKTSWNGLLFLAENEGCVLPPYQDSVGVWTIGIGHTAAAGAPDPATSPPLTLEDALALFEDDVVAYEDDVNDVLTYDDATQYQFDAAVSFHYNTGAIATANWVEAWNRGALDEAAAEMMNWCNPDELYARRKREQALFATGDYGEPFVVSVWETAYPGPVTAVTVEGEQPPAVAVEYCPTCGQPLPT
jgi:lysozyme